MATQHDGYLTVTDLKQYTHCQRVTYFEQCLPHIRPRTYKMDAGREAHQAEQKRAARRTLRQYGVVDDGERAFDVPLISPKWRLSGAIDEIVTTESGQLIPVDYKLAKKVGAHHRLQLTAYALMLEDLHQITIEYGFIYLIPQRKTVKVIFRDKLRRQFIETIMAIHDMILHERMPSPAPHINYCLSCEFRRFCNDVC